MATQDEIMAVMQMLCEYYDKDPSESQARIYLNTLADIPGDALEKAAYDWIAESHWFPKVNQLRDTARKVIQNNNRATEYADYGEYNSVRKTYWAAMDLFNASLRDKYPIEDIYADRVFAKYFQDPTTHQAEVEVIEIEPAGAENA